MSSELYQTIELIGREKGLETEIIVQALEEAWIVHALVREDGLLAARSRRPGTTGSVADYGDPPTLLPELRRRPCPEPFPDSTAARNAQLQRQAKR